MHHYLTLLGTLPVSHPTRMIARGSGGRGMDATVGQLLPYYRIMYLSCAAASDE